MQVVTKEKVESMIKARRQGEFTPIINQLEKGGALCISPNEWKKRTPIPYYFLGKFNRGQKTVSVLRHGDYYYVIRL
jgi:hypothetical protein